MPIDTAVIGTVVMDVTAESVGLQVDWKDKQRIDGIRLAIGGDGANQSIRMADLDMSVAITGCVGKDMAGMLAMEALRKRGVDVSHMTESSDRETGTALILLRNDGDRNIFSNNGAHPQVYKEDCAWIRKADIRALSIASLFCLPWLEEDGLLSLLEDCRKRGILTFADLGSDKKKQGLSGIQPFLPWIDYFLPSEEDALAMTGTDTPEKAAEVYLQNGASAVVIKCAARGAYYRSTEESGWVPALPVVPVDTTGAGDCFAAHFIHGILAGRPLREACIKACEAASLSTLARGASAVPIDYTGLHQSNED